MPEHFFGGVGWGVGFWGGGKRGSLTFLYGGLRGRGGGIKDGGGHRGVRVKLALQSDMFPL